MKNIRIYLKEVKEELLVKVSWPSWQDLQGSVIVVSIASLIIAVLVFIIDFIIGVSNIFPWWKGIVGFIYSFFS